MASATSPVAEVIIGVSSGLTTTFIGYLVVTVRKGAKKLMGQHEWLMSTTKDNSDQIAENTRNIKMMLEQREELISQGRARVPRSPQPRTSRAR